MAQGGFTGYGFSYYKHFLDLFCRCARLGAPFLEEVFEGYGAFSPLDLLVNGS